MAPVFFAFRVMVGLGLLMIAARLPSARGCGGAAGCSTRAGTCARAASPWPAGFVAILAGWMVTEIGRQPWVAYGILRTADAASPVSAAAVALSLALIVVTYVVVFSIGIWYIRKLVRKGPVPALLEPSRRASPNRPLSAAQRATVEARAGECAIMSELTLSLPVVWALVIGTAVALYVVLDGFDLGIGILFPLLPARGRPRPDDELGRAVLGRQRDLAGAGRRRAVGRLSRRPSRSSCRRCTCR